MDQQPALPDQKTETKHLTVKFLFGAVFFGFIMLITVGLTIIMFTFPPAGTAKSALPQQETKKESTQSAQLLTPSINRAEWTFEIFNGTATKSAEQKIADNLKGRGYTITKQGPAAKNTYTVSELYIAETMQAKASLLLEDIQEFVKVASISGSIQDSTASARLIVGTDQL